MRYLLLYLLLGSNLACLVMGCSHTSPPTPTADETPGAGAISSIESALDADSSEEKSLQPQTARVPELTGFPVSWARQLLHLKQLQGVNGRLCLPADQWQTEWIEGRVYLQTPQTDTVVKPEVKIAYWSVHRAADNHALIEVPDVIGKSGDVAKKDLESLNLAVMTVTRTPTEKEQQESGMVLDQYPRAQQVLGPTSTVLLHVAESPAQE